MTQAVDHKKILTRKYQAWRVLGAPAAWSAVYQERRRRLRKFRGGLIFPEQLLGLNQKSIYQVKVDRSSDSRPINIVNATVTEVRSFHVKGDHQDRFNPDHLEDVDAILDYEKANHDLVNGIKVGDHNLVFYNTWLFSNRKDALAFQTAEVNRLLG